MKILFIVNIDWFFISHRLPIAIAAKKAGHEIHLATCFTTHESTLAKQGIITHGISFNRRGSSLRSIFTELVKLISIVDNVKPDIVHLVTIKPVLLGGIAIHFSRPKPAVVAAVSGLGFIFVSKGIIAKIRRLLVSIMYRLAFSHKKITVIFQNIDDLNLIKRISKLPKSRTTLIEGSGIEIDKYCYKLIPKNHPIVLFPARLLISKGILDFIEASKILYGKARFVIVGKLDTENPDCISFSLLSNLIKNNFIEYWGFSKNISKTIQKCSIVVLPSYREGFPKILMEAAACGRPIITTNVPGCRDAIIPNKSGLLVPLKDPSFLASEISRLLGDFSLLTSMSKAGRELAESKYDLKIVVEKHMKIYSELMS